MSNDKINTEIINAQISEINSQGIQTGEKSGSGDYSYPYVIFQLFENKFAVNCKYVISIENVSETTELVNTSRDVRGIAYYKNEPISVFDLRRLFGFMSKDEYTSRVVNLPQRIKEHEIYAETLLECINSGAPFKLTVNPRECAFGKWFYNYKQSNPPGEAMTMLRKIEYLHSNFHETGKSVRDLIEKKNMEKAAEYREEIDDMKNNIAVELNGLQEMLIGQDSELNIVLQLKDKKIGLIIDSAESVEEIDEIQNLPPSVVTTKYVRRLGLSKKEKQIIFILEAAEFGEAGAN